MKYVEILRQAEAALSACGVEESRADAWYLFSHCFHMDRARYLMSMGEEAPAGEAGAFLELVGRRGNRIPLQQLLGTQEFMGLSFFVDSHVLIPRQDTEILAEAVIREEEKRKDGPLRILDLCTGSGCIGISLAVLLGRGGHSQLQVVLSDISPEALFVADENIRRLGCGDRCRTVRSDLFESLSGQRFHVIVSNPPYIPPAVIEELSPEVRDHEPRLALDGGSDGLDFYRRIADRSPAFLEPGGVLWLEIGWDQAEAVSVLLKDGGFTDITVKKDLAGKDRVIRAALPPSE